MSSATPVLQNAGVSHESDPTQAPRRMLVSLLLEALRFCWPQPQNQALKKTTSGGEILPAWALEATFLGSSSGEAACPIVSRRNNPISVSLRLIFRG